MIQGNQNSINKAMLALILHTLQDCDSEEILPAKEQESEEGREDEGD